METYALKEGLTKLTLEILAKQVMLGVESAFQFQEKKPEKNIVVAIAGGSATNKTNHVAQWVKEKFGGLLLSMDDYYRGKAFMEAEAKRGNLLNWDQLESLNLELLKNHLKALRAGRSVKKPVYNFKTGEVEKHEIVPPKNTKNVIFNVIILEGPFALHPSLSLLEEDIKVFVDTGRHRGRGRKMFVEATNADFIITNKSSFNRKRFFSNCLR